MRDEARRQIHREAAQRMWAKRREEGWVMPPRTKEKKESMIQSREANLAGKQAVIDRMHRLEARLRGLGYSNEEIRMM